MTLADVPGIVTARELRQTVDAIAEWQLPSGMIPWFPGGHADPWNHVEAAMALTLGGRHAEAVQAGLRIIGAEPLRESGHRLLIRSWLAQGNLGQAVRQFQACRRVLRAELGVDQLGVVDHPARGLGLGERRAAVGVVTRICAAGGDQVGLGEIEHLPVADQSVDVILSNCVINLSPDKAQVFREAFRVLKPGGRLAITDMVATAPLPESVRQDLALYTGCVAGAAVIEDLEHMLAAAGFTAIRIQPRGTSDALAQESDREREAGVVSATLEATKP